MDYIFKRPLHSICSLFFCISRAGAIKQALDNGADFVVTGRCTDSALVLAPLMHKVSREKEISRFGQDNIKT